MCDEDNSPPSGGGERIFKHKEGILIGHHVRADRYLQVLVFDLSKWIPARYAVS